MLNGLFRNYSDRERLPLGAQIAVIAVVLLFFGLTIEIDKTMTCKNQYSYCTVESHNFFRIKNQKDYLYLKMWTTLTLIAMKKQSEEDIIIVE